MRVNSRGKTRIRPRATTGDVETPERAISHLTSGMLTASQTLIKIHSEIIISTVKTLCQKIISRWFSGSGSVKKQHDNGTTRQNERKRIQNLWQHRNEPHVLVRVCFSSYFFFLSLWSRRKHLNMHGATERSKAAGTKCSVMDGRVGVRLGVAKRTEIKIIKPMFRVHKNGK